MQLIGQIDKILNGMIKDFLHKKQIYNFGKMPRKKIPQQICHFVISYTQRDGETLETIPEKFLQNPYLGCPWSV